MLMHLFFKREFNVDGFSLQPSKNKSRPGSINFVLSQFDFFFVFQVIIGCFWVENDFIEFSKIFLEFLGENKMKFDF